MVGKQFTIINWTSLLVSLNKTPFLYSFTVTPVTNLPSPVGVPVRNPVELFKVRAGDEVIW
mgnify:CR=1 FL=1